jgi:hypothetical protein
MVARSIVYNSRDSGSGVLQSLIATENPKIQEL